MRTMSGPTRRMRAARCLFALAGLTAAAACNDDTTRPQLRTLAAAEAQWQASSARDAYVITQTRECFCPFGPTAFSVTVIRDTITLVRNLSTGDVVDPAQWTLYRTVLQLFAEVRRSLATPGMLREVQYDATRGIPTTLSLDPVLNAVDDEIVYRTTFVGPAGSAP